MERDRGRGADFKSHRGGVEILPLEKTHEDGGLKESSSVREAMDKLNPSYDLAILKSEMVHLRKDVNRILEILIEHPDKSLSPRVHILESQLKDMERSHDRIDEHSWQLNLFCLPPLSVF